MVIDHQRSNMKIEDLLGYSTADLVALANKGDSYLEELLGEHFKYTRPELVPTKTTTDSVKVGTSKAVKSANKTATAKATMMVELAAMMKQANVKV